MSLALIEAAVLRVSQAPILIELVLIRVRPVILVAIAGQVK
jgi:hypothetical protein